MSAPARPAAADDDAASGDGAGAPAASFVPVDGARLHVLDWGGEGPPLVLVPGAGASGWVYAGIAPRLTDRCRVLAISPRGHGVSEPWPARLTLQRCAADVAGAMDALGVRGAVVGAHSLSGHVAVRLAAGWPGRARALVLLDGVVDYAGWLRMRSRDPFQSPRPENPARPERAWLERCSYGSWSPVLEADWRAVPDDPAAPSRARVMTDLMEDAALSSPPYAALDVPVLAVVAIEAAQHVWPWVPSLGASARATAMAFLRDVRHPFRRGVVDRFRRAVPRARVVEIPGHHFVFLSSRDAVVAEMRAFLESLG